MKAPAWGKDMCSLTSFSSVSQFSSDWQAESGVTVDFWLDKNIRISGGFKQPQCLDRHVYLGYNMRMTMFLWHDPSSSEWGCLLISPKQKSSTSSHQVPQLNIPLNIFFGSPLQIPCEHPFRRHQHEPGHPERDKTGANSFLQLRNWVLINNNLHFTPKIAVSETWTLYSAT